MNTKEYCYSGIILLCGLYLLTQVCKKYPTESFIPMKRDEFLVSEMFPVRIRELNVNYEAYRKYVPQTPLASFEQITNNFRYVSTPEEGSALVPELSAFAFYDKIRV
jgi:hypothetical protein